jgi:hypothetical protein
LYDKYCLNQNFQNFRIYRIKNKCSEKYFSDLILKILEKDLKAKGRTKVKAKFSKERIEEGFTLSPLSSQRKKNP